MKIDQLISRLQHLEKIYGSDLQVIVDKGRYRHPKTYIRVNHVEDDNLVNIIKSDKAIVIE